MEGHVLGADDLVVKHEFRVPAVNPITPTTPPNYILRFFTIFPDLNLQSQTLNFNL